MDKRFSAFNSKAIALRSALCTAALLLVAMLMTANAHAQAIAADLAQPPSTAIKARPEQTIQRIRTEDAGTRIDELRVGGQTQSITVQPKINKNIPAYEIKPADHTQGGSASGHSGDTTGSRVWNVLKF